MQRSFICLLFVVSISSVLSLSQVATGTPPFGSFSQGTFDTVDLANLNVHFAIPILGKAGRGLPFHYLMDYESSIWVPTNVNNSVLWQPVNSNWGWTAQSEALTGSVPVLSTTGSCFFTDPNSGLRYKIKYPTTTYSGYKDPSGTFHSMPVVTTNGDSQCDTPVPPVHTGSIGATDGSGYLLTINELSNPKVLVTSRSGWTMPNPGTSTAAVVDTNGNELTTSVNGSATTFTDTLGTTALSVNVVNSSTTTYSYTAPSGAQAEFTFNYTQKTVQTNFGCSGIGEYPATQVYLLTSISLPDTTSYTFTYEQTLGKAQGVVTGRIASVQLPTGGTISYGYGSNGITCTDGSAATLQRQTLDGTWTYVQTAGTPSNTTVTDPHGSQTSLVFFGILETARTVQQKINGTQTQLAYIRTCYNGNGCSGPPTLPITRRTVTAEIPNANGVQSQTDTFYNSIGLATESDQYGYGNGAPGSLLRKTLITYNTSLTNHILDHQSSVVIQDGGNNLIGQMTYTYDEGQVSQNTGTPPQHVGVSGSRGNLTSLSNFYSATGSLSKHYSYYDTGTVNVATDVNGAPTTYGYGSGSCGYSFPDSVTLSLNLSRSTTYNCTGGVVKSFKDENQNTSYINYTLDPYFWRPESTQDPAGAVTNISYTGATQVETALNFNGGNSTVDLLTTLDPLGRLLYSQQKQSPTSSNYDSIQLTYDAVNALVKGTMPFTGTAGSPAPGGTPMTTTNLDTLGRTTLITDAGSGTVSLA